MKSFFNLRELDMKIFNCKTDAKAIAAYAKCADEQIDNFEKLFPWKNDGCDSETIYIVVSYNKLRCPTILGWMKTSIGVVDTLKICFVHAISTAHTKYKHIGQFMMDTLELKMRKQKCDMIELSPLPSVISFYELLGYRSLYGAGPYYKWIGEKREDVYVTLAYSKTIEEE